MTKFTASCLLSHCTLVALLLAYAAVTAADSSCGRQVFFGREADCGRVTSPHYPKAYIGEYDSLNCTYVIEERAGWKIQLEMLAFSTHPHVHTLTIYSRTVVVDTNRKGKLKAELKVLARLSGLMIGHEWFADYDRIHLPVKSNKWNTTGAVVLHFNTTTPNKFRGSNGFSLAFIRVPLTGEAVSGHQPNSAERDQAHLSTALLTVAISATTTVLLFGGLMLVMALVRGAARTGGRLPVDAVNPVRTVPACVEPPPYSFVDY